MNTASFNYRGVCSLHSSENNITNNTIFWNEEEGIFLSSSNSDNIIENTIYNNENGIYLTGTTGNNISRNNISSNLRGIYLSNAHGDYIFNNIAFHNDNAGIYLQSSNENIIKENSVFDNNNGYGGIALRNSNGNNICDNNASLNDDYGIYLENSKWNNITNNTALSNKWRSIYLRDSNYNNITSNNIFDGIYFFDCVENRMVDNTFVESSIYIKGDLIEHWNTHNITTNNTVNGKPIYYWKNRTGGNIPLGAGQIILANCSDVNIGNQELTYGSIGIALAFSSNINITANNVSTNTDFGIYLLYSFDNNITSNYISNNRWGKNYCGIYLSYSDYNNISNNSILNCYYEGISIHYSQMNSIYDNNISNHSSGIYLHFADLHKVINNTVYDNDYGIELSSDSNLNIVQDNTVYNNGYGILFSGSNNGNITKNNISGNSRGIELNWSTNIKVSDNSLSKNHYSIYLWSADYSILNNNIIIGNFSQKNDYGVYLDSSKEITMAQNTMLDNGVFIRGEDLEHWNTHNIDTSNSVNGKSLYYYKNQTGGSIPSNPGQIILANCTNYFIEYHELTNSYVGIELGFSSNSSISNNNIRSNYYGVYLYSSTGVNILNNNASNTIYGFYLEYSDGNNLTNNNASSNVCGIFMGESNYNEINNCNISSNSGDGIFFDHSYYNIILNNIISSNYDEGIALDDGSWNEIHYNTISSNNDYGIWVYGGDNKIFYNNFINNTNQARDISWKSDWDNGYPHGGNYWSDYGGSDNYTGRNQNIPGSDGIGDNSYMINFGVTDRYPLIGYFENLEPRAPIVVIVSPLNNSITKPGRFLDFEVYDTNLDFVNYSIDGDPVQPFNSPYNLLIDGWQDGIHEVVINAKDILNYSVSKTFYFIIDSTKPNIFLNTPSNNSIVKGGTILDFSIVDLHLNFVRYSIDGGINITLSEPFNISIEGWANGVHIIQIYAADVAGNSNTSWFSITTESTKPQIILNSPVNNSFILSGTFLNFSIVDTNLIQVNYSINGVEDILLSDPYNISTIGWPDGECTIQINAIDQIGNSNSSWFTFIIDSTLPHIIINSPLNNSIIPAGTLLNFSVSDPNLIEANYSLNKGLITTLSEPFDISTEGWVDGEYTVLISSLDLAGNFNSSWFTFTLDSTPPSILIDPNLNHSTLGFGESFQLNISDSNLEDVIYSLDDGDYYSLTAPYIIDTSEWSDGSHNVKIKANDLAENVATIWFEVTIDSIHPYIVSSIPSNQSNDIENNVIITITFNEPINKTGIENYVTFTPQATFTFHWNQDGNTLSFSFAPNRLANDTTYRIKINAGLEDLIGNPMSSDFELVFTTKADPSTESVSSTTSESAFPIWILGIIAILTAILIILLFLIGKIKRGASEEDEEEEDQNEKESPEEKSSHHEESIAKTSWKLKCPKCKKNFRIVDEEKPAFAKCPKCGKKWRMPD
jgi:parallel beta-helix repeat protein